MEITITSRHCDLSPAVKEHTEEKLSRLDRYFDGIQEAQVIISKEKFRYQAEITLKVPGRADLVSTEETTDEITSVDGAIDRLERQVKKHKGRLVDRREKAERVTSALADDEVAADAADDGADPD
jgi:putative sigma-54 modulation protein